MTYWVQNSATRKIFVGIIVLVIVLGVSIPLTVFALNDEEDLKLVPVPSEPAVASIAPLEGNGPSDSPADQPSLGKTRRHGERAQRGYPPRLGARSELGRLLARRKAR